MMKAPFHCVTEIVTAPDHIARLNNGMKIPMTCTIERRNVDAAGKKESRCVGDLFYDQLQLSHPEWSTPWDHDTVRAVRTRRRLLDRAVGEHLLVHAYHLPFPGLGTITRHGSAYRWQPLRHDESQHAPTLGP